MHRPAIPLAPWAERELAGLSLAAGCTALRTLDGTALLCERALLNHFPIPGTVSPGGGCRLYPARNGWVALNLARTDDRELLPALFSDESLDPGDDSAIAERIAQAEALPLVARGREMGLALAATTERPASPPLVEMTPTWQASALPRQRPLVVDLAALWAGPLAAHLLQLAGAKVIKVESRARPDAMRDGDPGLFARINQHKDMVALDLADTQERQSLLRLLARADIVIEAARPRALAQWGIDAAAFVQAKPGQVWISITGHGANGEAANWVGFGDDTGVAGGLSAALHAASGEMGFGGDAIGDPLTGIFAARQAWERWHAGQGGRIGIAMSAVVASALAAERQRDPAGLADALRGWAMAQGQPFPSRPLRPAGPVRNIGADNATWLKGSTPC